MASEQEPIDLSSLEGLWLNTSDAPKWLGQIALSRGATGWRLKSLGVCEPKEPGETDLLAYVDNMGYLGFKGEYTLPDRHLSLAANTQKELIVVTSFHRLGPGNDSRNFVCREFFYRDRPQ